MTIDSLDVIFYTFQFVLPGYLIVEIITSLMPRKKYSEGVLLVQTIGYSIVNLVIWSWLFWIIRKYIDHSSVYYWIANTSAVLVTGAITGFVIGIIRRKNCIRRLFGFLGITLEHPIPRAWDYKFSEGREFWVEVMLSNGKVVRGLYSGDSFASSDPECRDLYLEQLFQKGEDDEWHRVSRTAGIWINPDEIRFVKLYEMEEQQ